jgi:hypothetical protein
MVFLGRDQAQSGQAPGKVTLTDVDRHGFDGADETLANR